MNSENSDDAVLFIAQQTAAIADVVAIICGQLSAHAPHAAKTIAESLDAVANNPDMNPTPAFQSMAPWFAEHLRGSRGVAMLSLSKTDPSGSNHQQLQALWRRMMDRE